MPMMAMSLGGFAFLIGFSTLESRDEVEGRLDGRLDEGASGVEAGVDIEVASDENMLGRAAQAQSVFLICTHVMLESYGICR